VHHATSFTDIKLDSKAYDLQAAKSSRDANAMMNNYLLLRAFLIQLKKPLTRELSNLDLATNTPILGSLTLFESQMIDESMLFQIFRNIALVMSGHVSSPLFYVTEEIEEDMQTLTTLLKNGEHNTLEVKKAIENTDNILKAISAMANSSGGTVVVGLSEKRDESRFKGILICDEYCLIGCSNNFDKLKDDFTNI